MNLKFNLKIVKVMWSKKIMSIVYIMSTLPFIMCNNFKLAAGDNLQMRNCPLWHVRKVDKCECGAILYGVVQCDKTVSITVGVGHCMTWDNVSHGAILQRCPLSHKVICPKYRIFAPTKIPTNVSGAELNNITCKYTTDRVHVVSIARMAMDQLHFLMASLVLTAVNTDIYG